MNKKKLCMGAMALALSVGSVVQTSVSYTIPVAYADDTSTEQVTKDSLKKLIEQEEKNQPAEIDNASDEEKAYYTEAIKKAKVEVDTADQAKLVELNNLINSAKANLGKEAKENKIITPSPVVDENRTKLQNEVNNLKKFILTPRFINASKAEQDAYKKAVEDAKKALEDNPKGEVPNAETLIDNIQSAKKNLTGTAFGTTSNREALSISLKMASKLKTQIADNKTIGKEDKDSLSNKITTAENTFKDQASTAESLDNQNKLIAEEINRVVEKYNLNAEDIALSTEELKAVQTENNKAYAKAYQKLFALNDEITKFISEDDYKNLNNNQVKNTLTTEKEKAVEIYNNPESTIDQLNDAYTSLNKAYIAVKNSINPDSNEVIRLKSEIISKTRKNPDNLTKATKSAQATYNKAKDNAIDLAGKDNTKADDLREALNNLKLAELGLTPVPTVIVDDTKTELQREIENLKALVDKKSEVMSGEKYKNASKTSQEAYRVAISDAKDILDKKNKTIEEVKSALKLIELKSKLDFETDTTDYDKAREQLDTLVKNQKTVKNSASYRNAGLTKQAAYDQAIQKANILLTKIANKEVVPIGEINDAKKSIDDALKDIGYVADVAYPTALADLIAEATEFRQNSKFVEKLNSDNTYKKNLASAYNDLIKKAKEYIDAGGTDKDIQANFVNQINSVKMAIMDEMTEAEINLRMLIWEEAQFENSTAYKKAVAHTNPVVRKASEDYKDFIIRAKTLLNNTNRTDNDLNKIRERIESAKAVINYPGNKKTVALYNLASLIDDAAIVMQDADYTKAPQARRDAIAKAVKKAQTISINSKEEDIEAAISDLEAALGVADFRKILKKDNNKNLLDMATKDLLELARNVVLHPDFDQASKNQVDALKEALNALDKAIRDKDKNAEDEAKTRLVSTLLADTISPITEKVLNGEVPKTSIDQEILNELKALISTADRVVGLDGFKDLDKDVRDEFEKILKEAKQAQDSTDQAVVTKARDNLKTALANDKIKHLVEEAGRTARAKVEEYIKGDEALRKTTNFIKAQKTHKDNYIKAIDEAKKLLDDDKTTDKEFESARANIEAAVKALDGNQYAIRLKALKEDFEKNGSKIADANKRAAIEKKIKELEDNEGKTMDDLITVETELKNAQNLADNTKKVNVSSQPVKSNPGTTVTPVTTPTTTTTPVTTTSTVPATVNPGGIVRTGIRSLIGVVVVLAIALGAYFALTKKDKKNKTTTVNKDNEKKTRTFEGDSNEVK